MFLVKLRDETGFERIHLPGNEQILLFITKFSKFKLNSVATSTHAHTMNPMFSARTSYGTLTLAVRLTVAANYGHLLGAGDRISNIISIIIDFHCKIGSCSK